MECHLHRARSLRAPLREGVQSAGGRARPRWARRLPSGASRLLNFRTAGLLPEVPALPDDSAPLLLKAVARGDDKAVERCLTVYGPLVWSIVRRRVKDRFAAEDLVQEIFTEVWRGAGGYDPGKASEGGFIAMIARRRVIDWVRRQERLPRLEAFPEGEAPAVHDATPGLAMDRDLLWSALGALPEETRRLFVLHFEKGMTHCEISETTGMPLGTVKTRLRRGLVQAKEILEQLHGGAQPRHGAGP